MMSKKQHASLAAQAAVLFAMMLAFVDIASAGPCTLP